MSWTLRLVVLFLASALLVGIGCLGGSSLRHDESQPTVLDCFKVATDGGPLLLPVEIQESSGFSPRLTYGGPLRRPVEIPGKRFPFVLKTGTSRTVYAPAFRAVLGKEILSKRMRMLDREAVVSFCRPPAAKLGHLDLPKKTAVVCMELGQFGEFVGEEIAGFLGMDFLSKHIFRIDFDRGEVTFLTSAGADAGQRLTAFFYNDLPHVMVEIPGLPGLERFAVDTGAIGTTSGDLRRDAFAALVEQGIVKPEGEALAVTPAGAGKDRLGRVESISVAGFRHQNLVLCESDKNCLRLNYLSRFVVTFDFPNKAIYFKKGRQYDRAQLRDLSGLVVLRRNGQTFVHSVKEGSLAERAGVKPQDVLLRIDDIDTKAMSLMSIYRLFCSEDKMHRLGIRRGEKDMEVELVLHDR